jgi:hypothetical protein
MIKQDNKCYYFEEINFDKGLFDDSVDATYILYLEGNGRYESIRSQLEIYKPTKKVYIVHNKGYKKCFKENIKYSTHDCANSHIEAYIHAENMSYKNILILEDDFEFVQEIKKTSINIYLNNFFKSKINTNFVYYLGVIPIIIIPYDLYSYKVILSGGAHAYIASKKYREKILSNKKKFIESHSLETYINKNTNSFTYKTYLCTQLFPETENRQNWRKIENETLFSKFLTYCIKKYPSIIKLDKQIEPGYSMGYIGSKILFWLSIIIIIFICYKIYIKYNK